MRRDPLVRLAGASAIAGFLLSACRPDSVRVAYRPAAGSHAAYELRVTTTSTLRLGDEPPRTTTDEALLRADHVVLGAAGDAVRVRVRITRPGSSPRTFVARLDREARLVAIDRVESLPASAFGDLGFDEVFPAAAAGTPDRPLRPGDRWVIDEPLALGNARPARLRGEGRLAEVGLAGNREVASVRSRTLLAVQRKTRTANGDVELRGTQRTRAEIRHWLSDGSVEDGRSQSHSQLAVTVTPPAGRDVPAVSGTLALDVRSVIRRLR